MNQLDIASQRVGRVSGSVTRHFKHTSDMMDGGLRLRLIHPTSCMNKLLLVTLLASALSSSAVAASPDIRKEPLDSATLSTIKSKFGTLMQLANRHDFQALHDMFWQSPSTLLVAKSAIQSEGNWAGFWGNEAVDR